VIRMRYGDLPAGLHIRVVARGKDTIVYMVPGLTAAQRQAALRRARSSGRMGQGPRLPVAGVAAARAVDRMRTTVRNGAAAVRAHPAMFVLPLAIILTAAVAYMLQVSVSIKVREPQASGQGGLGAPIVAVQAPPGSGANHPGAPPAPARTALTGKVQRPGPGRPAGHRGAGASPAPSPSASPSPTGTAPAPGRTHAPPPAPVPVPTAGGGNSAGSAAGAPIAGETCLDVGPLGVCLSL
jgi:hypothetical protein